MVRIDEPPSDVNVLYYSNCLTCNDATNTILSIIVTPDKYKAMILANQHIRDNGEGHQVVITYSSQN